MTIALVLIVKNEEETLPILAKSVKGLIDTTIIVDTGSTDNTIAVAKEVFSSVEIYELPWTNFGTARSQALSLARGKADWLLMLDADQVVTWHPDLPNWLSDKSFNGFMINHNMGGASWYLPRLLAGNQEWKFIGSVHEYLDPEDRQLITLYADSLSVFNPRDGGSIRGFDKDIELLLPEAENGCARSRYYLAQSYKDSGDAISAIESYRIRAFMPDTWEEEAWHASYQAGKLADDPLELLLSWIRRPGRAEPLQALSEWIARNKPMEPPADDVLFIEPNSYNR